MAALRPDETPEARNADPAPMRRILGARWIVGVLAALVLALYFGGSVSAAGAIVLLLGLVLATAFVPRSPSAGRLTAEPGPALAAWPETGIKRFAAALPDPCFVLDRRGIVRYANERAIAAFSIRVGEPLALRLRVPDLTAALDRVAKGASPELVEFAERVPTERWFAAWFAGIDGGDGLPPSFIVLIIDDLTERRRSERIRVDFVANASHELRTPLASLTGFIETLQGPAREDPVARERFLSIMHSQATRMSRLIDDLLSLSRIELKAHMRPSGEADLAAIVRHLADALEPLARELGVTIETELPGMPVIVRGERDELIQVFENLIENACKYGQAGERVLVTVSAHGADGGPAVSVRDFGPGIAAEHLPRLTERFYRAEIQASPKHRGTGLGLAIAKHILTRHQARLTIESRLGEGATFTVLFPQRDAIENVSLEENSSAKSYL
jgi:two-component system phosphate regulon sensor histidine kinase PhoR